MSDKTSNGSELPMSEHLRLAVLALRRASPEERVDLLISSGAIPASAREDAIRRTKAARKRRSRRKAAPAGR